MEKKPLLLLAKAVGLVAIALVVMLVVHFTGGQSILPWASFFVTIVLGIPSLIGSQSKLNLSLDVNRTVKPQQPIQKMASEKSNSIEWSNDAEKNLMKVKNSPEWRKVDDSTYSSWRKVGSLLHNISNRIQSGQHIDKNHLRIGQIIMVVFGCSWFLIILIELMATGGLNPVGFSTLEEISPFSYSVDNLPVFQIALSLALFLVPIGYLDWKTGTTCDGCNSPFSPVQKENTGTLIKKRRKRKTELKLQSTTEFDFGNARIVGHFSRTPTTAGRNQISRFIHPAISVSQLNT